MLISTFEVPGEYTVQLAVNDARTHYYVTYGLAPAVTKTDFCRAFAEFTACCMHVAQCASLLDDTEE